MKSKSLLTSSKGPIITGLVVGILAPVLVHYGNPGNMGICVACFTRDLAGALGFHRAVVVQYIRPELIGMVLGSMVAAALYREFRPRSGSSPIIRFVLGAVAMIGALVFLGCPWRALLRLAGGDWSAIAGIVGLTAGIFVGVQFLKAGFTLGRNRESAMPVGLLMPILSIVLLLLLILAPQFGKDAAGNPTGPIFFSKEGPGSMAAPILLSLAVGLIVGFLAQRTRFCTVGAIRDVMITGDKRLLYGVIALVLAAAGTNLALGQFKPGFSGQPISQPEALASFLGMLLSGLAFTLAGGCPGRQFFLSGEGDGDATIFIMGMVTGAAISHNFNMAGSAAGPGAYSYIGIGIGLAICLALGFTMRDRALS